MMAVTHRTAPASNPDDSVAGPSWIASLRAVGRADRDAYRHFLDRISAADLQRRIHGGMKRVSEHAALELLDPAGRYGAAFGAFDTARALVAVARLAPDPSGTTLEIAVLVRSDLQRCGIARSLVDYVLGLPLPAGARKLLAHTEPSNVAALALARRHGFSTSRVPGENVVRLERASHRAGIDTPAPQPVPPLQIPPKPADPLPFPQPPDTPISPAPIEDPPSTRDAPVEEPGAPAPPQRAAWAVSCSAQR